MDREAWRAAIHWVAKSRTRLSDWTELNWGSFPPCLIFMFLFSFSCLIALLSCSIKWYWDSRHPCLILDLGRNTYRFFPLITMVTLVLRSVCFTIRNDAFLFVQCFLFSSVNFAVFLHKFIKFVLKFNQQYLMLFS